MTIALRHRRTGAIIVVGSALLIATMTLRPHGGSGTADPLWCLSCLSFGARASADLFLNTLLFVPFAFGLWHLGVGTRRALWIVLATTVAIELLQMVAIPGRYASVADIVTNTLGGGIGIAVAPRWPDVVLPGPVAARRFAIISALCWLALVSGSAFGMRPALPREGYTVAWYPRQLPGRAFTGQVLEAHANGDALPAGRYDGEHQLVRTLRDGDAQLDAALIADGRVDDREARIEVKATDGTVLVTLGQDNRDLVFRLRLRAQALRLGAPSLRVVNALPPSPVTPTVRRGFDGDTAGVGARIVGPHLSMVATVNGVMFTDSLILRPELGWAFLFRYPADAPGALLALIGALWLTVALVPVGYWAMRFAGGNRARRSTRATDRTVVAVIALTVASGMALIPALAGGAPVTWSSWVGAAMCIAIGTSLGRASNRLAEWNSGAPGL